MASITTYMSLTAWTDSTDAYSHIELANNFLAIDGHDHSSGKGKQIVTGGLADHSVTKIKLAEPAVDTTNLFDHSVTLAKLDVSLFSALSPLGVVQGFWRPSGSGLVVWGNRASGSLFELCDGRTIAASEHDLGVATSITLPNLIGRFVRFDVIGNVGVLGGADSLNLAHSHVVNAHTHQVAAHSHTVNAHSHTIPDHRHGISADGQHHHTFMGGSNLHTRPNAFISGLTIRDEDNFPHSNDLQSTFVSGFNSGGLDTASVMDDTGSHTHGGQTGLVSTGSLGTNESSPGTSTSAPATDAQSPGTNSGLGASDNRPAYFTLVPIVRVRNPS